MSSVLILAILGACGQPEDDHGHSHGGQGGHDDHGGEEEGESIAVTRWTDSHELFVELDAPVAGQPFAYHAHVTRMADNHAANSGRLTFRFEQDGFAVESHTDEAVARDGIFARQAMAPGKPGEYRMVLAYADGAERAEWDAGIVVVGAGEAHAHDGDDEGEIAFLKETQWQIPFLVEPSAARSLSPTLSAATIVRPAPGSTAVVAAPVEGLVAWSDALPVVGRTVKRGERLATLVPAGAAEHWARLQADLATARIDRGLAETTLARVEDLAAQEAVSARRADEASADLARAQAQVSAAQRRVSALTSGGAGAVPIRAPADGVIVAVGAAHGASISAGAPLVSVNSGAGVLLEGRIHERTRTHLTPLTSLTVMRGDWDASIDLLASGGKLLTERLIFDDTTLSASVSVLVEEDLGLISGDLVEMSIGVGSPSALLAVPHSAVVEINGQDVIFVQKTGESFSRRRVALGPSDATHVAILSGLSEGEMVVVQGGFDVHVASLSGALESHRH